MKLVDILARELKVWPEGECFAWQDYDREVRFSDSTRHDFFARSMAEDNIRYPFYADPKSGVTRAEWQAAVDALNAPKVVEWDGDGLPPVGIDCEVENEVLGGWDHAEKILAHSSINGKDVAVFQRGDLIAYSRSGSFRPTRTAEQVAAEERKSEILEMIDTFETDTAIWGRDAVMEICGHLWESGYRKEPKPCGS